MKTLFCMFVPNNCTLMEAGLVLSGPKPCAVMLFSHILNLGFSFGLQMLFIEVSLTDSFQSLTEEELEGRMSVWSN